MGTTTSKQTSSGNQDKDDVFSDSEAEETAASKGRQVEPASAATATGSVNSGSGNNTKSDQIGSLTQATGQVSIGSTSTKQAHIPNEPNNAAVGGSVPGNEVCNSESEFKAMAADASVFSFGDDEDYESE